LEDPDVERSIILNCIFKKYDGEGHGLDSSGSGYRKMAGSCENDNEY